MPTPPPSRPDCTQVQVTRVRGGALVPEVETDSVAEETPVALEFNGISHATMLATPADLEDFAVGFALSEGIIDGISDVRGIDLLPQCDGIVVQLEISTACEVRLKSRRRAMAGRTGCGLCGVETLPEVLRELPVLAAGPSFERAAIGRAMAQFQSLQTLQEATGAVHAAAWCSADGEVSWLREDVGRHNALDKLVGALAANEVDAAAGFIAVTSRASFEMVQKAAMAGVSLLAAVSAPTSFAVETAQRAGLTLVGFARREDLVVYCHPQRLPADTVPAAANGQRPH